MYQPKIVMICEKYVEYNGESFRIGDIVHYVMENGDHREEATGRFIEISDTFGGILRFDCSKEYESIIKGFNICNLKSISHVKKGGIE